VVSSKQSASPQFLAWVGDYLPMHTTVCETETQRILEASALPARLGENVFYRCNGDVASALCHAIEDLAVEEANGTLLAGMQTFQDFAPHRERYGHLAATLEQVQVIAAGRVPRRQPHLRFVRDGQARCRPFRAVLFEGRRCQVMFIARETRPAPTFEEREFVGFYSLNAGLMARMRHSLLEAAAGTADTVREFLHQEAVDRAAKGLDQEFARTRQMVNLAMRRLKSEGERYLAGPFASELEKGLAGLHQWKARMPDLFPRL
jgi:hypothetical protein